VLKLQNGVLSKYNAAFDSADASSVLADYRFMMKVALREEDVYYSMRRVSL
jgi:hypothetical protein